MEIKSMKGQVERITEECLFSACMIQFIGRLSNEERTIFRKILQDTFNSKLNANKLHDRSFYEITEFAFESRRKYADTYFVRNLGSKNDLSLQENLIILQLSAPIRWTLSFEENPRNQFNIMLQEVFNEEKQYNGLAEYDKAIKSTSSPSKCVLIVEDTLNYQLESIFPKNRLSNVSQREQFYTECLSHSSNRAWCAEKRNLEEGGDGIRCKIHEKKLIDECFEIRFVTSDENFYEKAMNEEQFNLIRFPSENDREDEEDEKQPARMESEKERVKNQIESKYSFEGEQQRLHAKINEYPNHVTSGIFTDSYINSIISSQKISISFSSIQQ